jgi:hypothetical protein
MVLAWTDQPDFVGFLSPARFEDPRKRRGIADTIQ